MKFPSWPNPIGHRDVNLGLTRVEDLLLRLGNPHCKLPPIIHVAGTNGKGSTLAYLASVFAKAGHKFHRYTSPHLVNFNERIVIANQEIDDLFLNEIIDECRLAAEIKPKIEVTFFEGTTVAAFLAFSRIKADILLLETGMGGRLDATNVVSPILSIITSISLDHTQFLGTSLKEIAFEKAGIIKPQVPVIIGKQKLEALEVIEKEAQKRKSPCLVFGKNWSSFEDQENEGRIIFEFYGKKFFFPKPNLIGDHQIENAGNAIMALLYLQNTRNILSYLGYEASNQPKQYFEIYNYHIKKGIADAKWLGRLQEIRDGDLFLKLPDDYRLFLDGAHNEDGARLLANWIIAENIKLVRNKKRKIPHYLICGMLEDKNSYDFFKYLSGVVDFVVGMPIKNDSKSKTGIKIAQYAKEAGIKSAYADEFSQVLDCIIAVNGKNNPAVIVVAGSLHLIGQFLEENN